ncbi:nitrite reductase [Desulfitobacterium sp. AusDCA]|uniref:nitrite reductase n=1 Tax=Desulfitobacterium sp. AusDCA TaxID=3240383 RepID=UPI003DA79164
MSKLSQNNSFSWNGDAVACDSGIIWGIAEQVNGLMAILVNTPGGVLTGKQLKALAEIVGEDGVMKISRRMSPILLIPKEKVETAISCLESAGLRIANLHKSVRNIVACPGKGFSSNSRGDTLELAAALDKEFYGTLLPWDLKIAIAGCPRNCAGITCQDIGLMAEPRSRFSLWLGGTETGMNPRHGALIKKGIPRAQVPAVIRKILEIYCEEAKQYEPEFDYKVRLYNIIEKTGLNPFLQSIDDVLAI